MTGDPQATAQAAGRARTRGRGTGGHRLAEAFEAVESLPALAESRDRLLRLTGKQGAAVGELADAIESDAALAIVVMRAANNGSGPGRGRISGVPQAVEALSAGRVRDLTSDLETYDLLHPGGPWHEVPERFRRHAVATRRAAERIGEIARLPGRDELALAALLHDVGRLVLQRLYGSYEELLGDPRLTPEERVGIERRELGIDHALVGGVLVRRWGMPSAVAAAVERHHGTEASGAASAVRLADMIAHHSHGDPVSSRACAEAAAALGLSEAKLRGLLYEFPYGRPARRRTSEPCPLSERELDALRGLATGKVYKEIADVMSLSASTVRTHLHNVYRKIGAVDRAQAVLIARDRGWI